MRFLMPNHPCDFEIPDDWWEEAGMNGFEPSANAYQSLSGAKLVALHDIEPPYRKKTVQKDWRGFDRARLISVLKGIATGATIDPVPLQSLPLGEALLVPAPYGFRVHDGYHRFYASIAAGFSMLPGAIPS